MKLGLLLLAWLIVFLPFRIMCERWKKKGG